MRSAWCCPPGSVGSVQGEGRAPTGSAWGITGPAEPCSLWSRSQKVCPGRLHLSFSPPSMRSCGFLAAQDHSQPDELCTLALQVSHDILLQLSSSYMSADAYPHPLSEFMTPSQGEGKDLHSYFEQSVRNLLKESSEKFKGWLSTPGPLNTELSCKKVNVTANGIFGFTR